MAEEEGIDIEVPVISETRPIVRKVKRVTDTFFTVRCKKDDELNTTNNAVVEPDIQLTEGKCYICFTFDADSVFFDCMHGGICSKCCLEVLVSGQTCALCRQSIRTVIKVKLESGDIYKVVSQHELNANNYD